MKHLRSYHLAVQFYRQAHGISLPRPLKDQFQRAASSIALNLAEGAGRHTRRDKLRFFHIAMGSIREVQAITELEPTRFTETQIDLLDHLAASTYKLTKLNHTPRPPT